MLVAQHLDLHVAGFLDIPLAVHLGGAEGRRRLGLAGGEGLGHAFTLADDAHAPATPAGRRLEDDGVADAVGDLLGLPGVAQGPLAAWHHRDSRLLGDLPRLDLVAHEPDGLGGRADERDAAGPTDVGKARVLGEKPIAGMDGLAVGDGRRRDDRRNVEVAGPRVVGADADRLVGEPDRKGLGIGRGMGDHGADPQLAARADDPHRDLAAIRDENLVEHGLSLQGSIERQSG